MSTKAEGDRRSRRAGHGQAALAHGAPLGGAPARRVIVLLAALMWAGGVALPGAGAFGQAAGGPGAPGAAPPPANVTVGRAELRRVRQYRQVVGQVQAARRSTLSAEQSGRVVQAPPETGVAVSEGQAVARVDATLLEIDRAAAAAALAEAEAQVEERRALLETAERNRQRIEGLVGSGVVNEKELFDARDEEAAARARLQLSGAAVAQQRARVRRLEEQIDKTVVRAPFDGYVVQKQAELGQWLDPGDAVAEVVETARVKVRLDVPQAMIADVPADEPIEIHIDALDRTRSGPVFSIVPDADPQARTFRVLIKLDNAEGELKPGMSVTARLPTSRTVEAMTVPKDAVQITPSGRVVYANRGGRAAAAPVTVRFAAGERFVVDGEIRDGEEVVVEGNERLTPGRPLRIVGRVTDDGARAEAQP